VSARSGRESGVRVCGGSSSLPTGAAPARRSPARVAPRNNRSRGAGRACRRRAPRWGRWDALLRAHPKFAHCLCTARRAGACRIVAPRLADWIACGTPLSACHQIHVPKF
jgi:hypothetical protein